VSGGRLNEVNFPVREGDETAPEGVGPVFNLLPRDTAYFDMFEQIAQHARSAAQLLPELVKQFPAITGVTRRIHDEEHLGDVLTRQALEHLDRAFATPFDREDIYELVDGLDEIIDATDRVAQWLPVYRLDHLEPLFQTQSQVLVQATTAVYEAVQRLRTARSLVEVDFLLREIRCLKQVGEDTHQAAISQLFAGTPDALVAAKWLDLFGHLEQALGACADVTNTLERMLLKNG
jgi:uncharacterized protein